jgi:hypothetical protein
MFRIYELIGWKDILPIFILFIFIFLLSIHFLLILLFSFLFNFLFHLFSSFKVNICAYFHSPGSHCCVSSSQMSLDMSFPLSSEILISEEQAKVIAQEYGLYPPYNLILCCEMRFHRICWKITREDIENLKPEDLAGLLIDAESGIVLEPKRLYTSSRKGYNSVSQITCV